MKTDPNRPAGPDPGGEPAPPGRRLFLLEPGWHVGLKVGSEREFCYMIAPGQDYYHRLLDGEILVYHGHERLCLACAERRGLLREEPRGLREPSLASDLEALADRPDYELDIAD